MQEGDRKREYWRKCKRDGGGEITRERQKIEGREGERVRGRESRYSMGESNRERQGTGGEGGGEKLQEGEGGL